MSIRARVEDALLLWDNGRKEGAFLNVLIATAATSRRRFPDRKHVSDRDAFVQFLEKAHTVRLSIEYRGECLPVEQVSTSGSGANWFMRAACRLTFSSCRIRFRALCLSEQVVR